MSFNTMSYFAGVGTVLAAVTFGLAGGFIMSNPTRKAEPPNRIERVAANAPLANSPGDQAAPVAQPAPAPQDSAAPDATPKDSTPSSRGRRVALVRSGATSRRPTAARAAAGRPATAASPGIVRSTGCRCSGSGGGER